MAREVGTEGKLGGQAHVKGVAGAWKDLTDYVNFDGREPHRAGSKHRASDDSRRERRPFPKITVDVRGEILELKYTINTMVDQLNSLRLGSDPRGPRSRHGRKARRAGGSEGRRRHLEGSHRFVNFMAGNLTNQVRGIAKVVTAVANGDLKRKLVLETKGEIAELADTINGMIDTLAIFADQVTTVAREVGMEGKLGGQARVPGAAGIWKDLTD